MIFRLANRSDDSQLRRLMRETVMPGHVRITYSREPDFFEAYRDMDQGTQVIIAEDNGRLYGTACRSIRNLLVNGKPAAVGYLSGLRLTPPAQNSTTLARGYAYLKTLHEDNKVPGYLTTIIQGNKKAKDMLTSGRANLPSYHPMGTYLTHVCPVKRRTIHRGEQKDVQMQDGTQVSPSELTMFLHDEGARRQFFPVYETNGQNRGMLHAIGLENVIVAKENDKIAGTIAVWNQAKCKQHVIAGYAPLFRLFRPILNIGLQARNYHMLPKVGDPLRFGVTAMICVKNNDTCVLRALLRQALVKASALGLHQLAIGLHESDPFVPVLREFHHVVYRSWLYLVCWEENSFKDTLGKTLVPYLELGTL